LRSALHDGARGLVEDTQCQHSPVTDGTACSDSNACTGSDHYIGADLHVHELLFTADAWSHNDLTLNSVESAPAAAANSKLRRGCTDVAPASSAARTSRVRSSGRLCNCR
jgi:hypothetical protein